MQAADLVVVAAAVVAGAVNAAAGSGSLVTFPALVAAGLPPVGANMLNTVGLAPGMMLAAWTDRRVLRDIAGLVWLLPIGVLGAVCGAGLLRVAPPDLFHAAVPYLIGAAAVLVAAQPVLVKRLRRTRNGGWLYPCVFAVSVYGGFFSAAQGILLLAVVGLCLDTSVPEQNAIKNVMQGLVSLVAGVFFLATSAIDWKTALILAAGSAVGTPLGIRLVRHISPNVFRIGVAAFGATAAVVFLLRG
ncbi:sulfite exporter TauE/SafE family protein [Mycobacterium sp. LTG2003]